MKTSRSLIFSLAHEIDRQRKPSSKRQRRHYDNGMPIDLRYDSGYYTAEPAARAQSMSASSSDVFAHPFADSAPGTIESFANNEENPEEVNTWGTGQLEEDEEELQQNNNQQTGIETSHSLSSPSEDEGIPVWGTNQLEDEATPTAPAAEAQSYDYPAPLSTASATRHTPTPTALPNSTPTDDPDTNAFQADIAAILSGKKTHPSTTSPNQPDAQESNDADEEHPPTPPAKPPGQAAAMTHDVFEKMGHPMATAQTFNLGSFALDRQLDTFDREIELKERKQSNHHKSPAQRPVAPTQPRPISRSATAINIRYDVPVVRQQTKMSCWAAGCAMIVAWRDQMSVDPAEIANATGTWAQYQAGLEPENTSIFPIWGMAPEPAQSYTVDAFCNLLERYGPLWVATAEPQGPHVRVVTGASGDGTPNGTMLNLNDPSGGVQTVESYASLVQRLESLARRESNVQGIYIAHNASPRP